MTNNAEQANVQGALQQGLYAIMNELHIARNAPSLCRLLQLIYQCRMLMQFKSYCGYRKYVFGVRASASGRSFTVIAVAFHD